MTTATTVNRDALRRLSDRPIPFVAGRSTERSHNIGLNIQQAKSLLLLNRRPPHADATGHRGGADADGRQPQPQPERSSTSVHGARRTERRQSEVSCPFLASYQHERPGRFDMAAQSSTDASSTSSEVAKGDEAADASQSIEEAWADYMYEVQEGGRQPQQRCTCYPAARMGRAAKSQAAKRRGDTCHSDITSRPSTGSFISGSGCAFTHEERPCPRAGGRTASHYPQPTVYSEAHKLLQMDDGRHRDAVGELSPDWMAVRTTKSAQLKVCMREIKRFQDHVRRKI